MGYFGVLVIVCKVCVKFWIVKFYKLVKFIKLKCVMCRKIEKKIN